MVSNHPHCEHTPQMGSTVHRPFWVLVLAIISRAAHQLGAAIFLAACLFGLPPATFKLSLIVAVASGLALGATEWLRHRQLHREIAGVITLIKLCGLGAAIHGILPLAETTLLFFIIASVGAHMPKQARHRLLY